MSAERPEEALWLPASAEKSLWLPTDDELALLSDDELAELHELLEEERRASEGAWTAQPKQALATRMAGEVGELLFGGAAGGGKTEWGIHYAVDECERWSWNRVVIFRRVFPSLNRTIIPRAKAVLRGRARWNGVEHTWTFPNGSVLEAAHLQHEDTVHDYQGAEYGLLYFEELTEFLESQYTYMLSRLRSPAPGIRPHAINTTNPGGRGHRWVKRRWVKPKDGIDYHGERPQAFVAWQPAPLPESLPTDPPPATRAFVPSTLEDNPALLQRDPSYRSRIRAHSSRGMRLALEKGDWDAIDAVEGALWRQSELDEGRVTRPWFGLHVTVARRVIAIDPSDGNEEGEGDGYGISICSRGMDGVCYVEKSDEWVGVSVRELARQSLALYHRWGCDALVVERNHGGRWLLEVLRGVDRYANVVDVWASHGKITRAEPVSVLFEPDPHAETFWTRYRARMVGVHEELEDELTSYTGEGASPNKLDALVWGVHELMLSANSGVGTSEDSRLAGRR